VTARVAVLIPCHDDAELPLEAVRSIDEPEPVEVVVVDDASTDPETVRILDELEREGIRVIRHERNRGVPVARMTALAATTAPYVFPLDADDLLVPGTLARMADRLDGEPDAAVCFGDYEEFGIQEIVRSVPETIDPFRVAYSNEWGAPMLRRSALEEIGGWQPADYAGNDFPYEDWHVWMGLAERGAKGAYLGPGVISYRRRIQPGRRLRSDRKGHRRAYRLLRELHPRLFRDLPEHRRRSPLPRSRKLLYPVLYGGRPRFGFEQRLRYWLDRAGIGPDRVLGRKSA
jgi:glycosyltransferase involved in cell wall biosynthesis